MSLALKKGWQLAAVLTIALGLTACVTGADGSGGQVETTLAKVVKNKQILAYLMEEVRRAGVSSLKLYDNAAIGVKCQSPNAYGCSTFDSGSRRGEVFLNTQVGGGTGIVNITHEIAHVGAFRRNCFAHGDVWLEYLMDMAKRFEAKFPNKNWGRSSPTGSVKAKYKRYASQRSRC